MCSKIEPHTLKFGHKKRSEKISLLLFNIELRRYYSIFTLDGLGLIRIPTVIS